jgi:hypothetical protein
MENKMDVNKTALATKEIRIMGLSMIVLGFALMYVFAIATEVQPKWISFVGGGFLIVYGAVHTVMLEKFR